MRKQQVRRAPAVIPPTKLIEIKLALEAWMQYGRAEAPRPEQVIERPEMTISVVERH